MLYMPESRQQMRPRLLLALLTFDLLAGLFIGLTNIPVFALSNKYDNRSKYTNVDNIFRFLG
jgi:hypothetical protein